MKKLILFLVESKGDRNEKNSNYKIYLNNSLIIPRVVRLFRLFCLLVKKFSPFKNPRIESL